MLNVRSLLLSCLLLCGIGKNVLIAQLDTIHWLPPMFPSSTMGDQYIYIYTPETVPFLVFIEDGSGHQVAAAMVSDAEPFIYKLSDTYSQLLKANVQLHQVLPNSGLMIHGSKRFHASFRLVTEGTSDACFLTCKGRAALGKVFRIGNIVQGRDKSGQRNNIIGIMATEDGTTIKLSDFDPTTSWRGAGQVTDPLTMQLQRGESVVFVHYVGGIGDDQPVNGFMGALLEASKPIAVTCGAWLGAPVVYAANDIGVDQILPLERVGMEYIFCKGDGPTTLEHPVIVAHTDGTKVWVNGSDTVTVTLDAGDFFSVPSFYYLPIGNIFIRTSEPVFAYQMTGGWDTGKTSLNTISLMFIPPLSCGIPHRIENIYLPNRIGPERFDGSLMIVALRDTPVSVKLDGQPVDLGPPKPLLGHEDFVTYKAKGAFSHVKAINSMRITSEGAVYATVVGRREFASYATFLNGYDYVSPEVHMTLHGDGICPDTLTASGFFDGIEWMYDDTLIQIGTDTLFVVKAPGRYKAIGYLGGCYHTDTYTDSLDVPLNAPQFDFSYVEPSCYQFPDGQIVFGLPNGGAPPYLYSIDHGQHVSTDPVIGEVTGGDYRLIVLDASGCYNEPVHFILHQPDSVYVHLVPRRLPDPLRPGDEVILQGYTTTPVAATTWEPPDTTGCSDCLLYYFSPEKTMWVKLTVFDPGGCPGTDSLLLSVEPPVYAPNVIYPASTHGNDRFMLYSKTPFPVHRLVIFNRWGGQVFEKKNFFTNSPEDGWDGTHHGAAVSSDTFAFLAEVEVDPGNVVQVSGTVMVMR